jgi:hypothetical protein
VLVREAIQGSDRPKIRISAGTPYAGTDRHRRRRWLVKCERCGWTKKVLAANLLAGRSKICGCVAYTKAHVRMKALMLAEKFTRYCDGGMTREQAKEQIATDYDKAVVR